MTRPSGSGNRVVLVEGESDRQVVSNLLTRECRGVNGDDVKISSRRGKEGVISDAINQLRSSVFASGSHGALGIIVDADDDMAAFWVEIKSNLASYGVQLPDVPNAIGTVADASSGRFRVGVWIMPDNEHHGELEDFLAEMVPSSDGVWPLSKDYIERIPEGERKFGRKKTRAEVLSWIATRRRPGRFDEAIKDGDLNTDAPLCQTFIAWLNRLFAESASPDPA